MTMTQLCNYVLDRSSSVLTRSSSLSATTTTTCGTRILQIRAIILNTEGRKEGRRRYNTHLVQQRRNRSGSSLSSNFKVCNPLRKLLYYSSRAWNTNRAGSAWMCPKVTQTIVSSHASNIRLLSLPQLQLHLAHTSPYSLFSSLLVSLLSWLQLRRRRRRPLELHSPQAPPNCDGNDDEHIPQFRLP